MKNKREVEVFKTFVSIWYLAEKMQDDIDNNLFRQKDKVMVKKVAEFLLRAESNTYKILGFENKPEIADQILIQNRMIDALLEKIEEQDAETMQKMLNLLGLEYDAV